MLSKIRQGLSTAGWSLAGDGMLLRLRNASIALVGAVAAVGLGLTLFISQLGFPAVFSSPIPGNLTEAGSVHGAVALSQRPGPGAGSHRSNSGAASPTVVRGHSPRVGRGSGGVVAAGGAGGRGTGQLAVSPGTRSGPVAQQPSAPIAVSLPTAQPGQPSPSAPAPAPTPAAVEASAQPNPGAQSKAIADTRAKPSTPPSTAKVTSDASAKPSTPPTGKDQQVGKSDIGPSAAKSNVNGVPAEKTSRDQSTTTAPTPDVSAPAPEAAGPAAAKEAADAAGSSWSRH